MRENDTWYQVDNVAKIFIATANKRDTRSFRVSCYLKEKVDSAILQEALDLATECRPQYQVFIRRGLFWHYMEETDILAKVEEEHFRPCPILYTKNHKTRLHYRVSYFGKRINLDMFHALTDGNGGLEFLNIIVQNYLKLRYPDKLSNLSVGTGAASDELSEDSFKHNFSQELDDKNIVSSPKAKAAYHIKGLLLPYNQMQFFEVHMSASEVLKLAKEQNATMTSYLGAKLMQAIYKDMPAIQKHKKPVTISMPVNLRNYFESGTSRNFFNSVYVSHLFDGTETTESLAKEFDAKLKAELTPEKVAQKMFNYEKMERLIFVRLVPLLVKNPSVALGTIAERRKVTAVISNLGRIQVPEEIREYIGGYTCFCSSPSMFFTISTYGDDLTFGISSVYRNTGILKKFIRDFTDKGIEVTVNATEVVR
ncbi:MAG: hypothetical protein HUJ71_08825 [Pseudobutyrivibrio sp.]|nr:hypothetical protein [Pseudobutyrivibrio sp.]